MRKSLSRKFWALVLLSSTAVVIADKKLSAAPLVTYSLSLHDDGTGRPTPANPDGTVPFAVYADVTPDNGGLFAFSIDMNGNFTTLLNMAPAAKCSRSG